MRLFHKKRASYDATNTVVFADNIAKPEIKLEIYGHNNTVIINTRNHFKAHINIGTPDCPVNNCRIEIGTASCSNGIIMMILENDTVISIGNDCMFSNNIQLWASDSHCVFDKNSGHLTNIGKYINIGNHVWVGTGCYIGKNTNVPDGCIIGMASVVTKSFDEANCVIAGNPATVVKRGVVWDKERPQSFINRNK